MNDFVFYPYDSVTIWTFDKSPESIYADWKNYLGVHDYVSNRQNDCFDDYWEYENPDLNFYFFFPIMPTWIEKVVDEFNNTFENIKIVILDNCKNNYTCITSEYGEQRVCARNGGDIILSRPLFTIEMSDKYSKNSKRFLRYFIHHFLRMLSLTHQYINAYSHCDNNFIDYVINLNNKMIEEDKVYKILSEVNIKYEKFLLMDDIDTLNLRFKELDSDDIIKQTEIYCIIADINLAVFKVGDKVKFTDVYNDPKIYTVIMTYRYIPYCMIVSGNNYHKCIHINEIYLVED